MASRLWPAATWAYRTTIRQTAFRAPASQVNARSAELVMYDDYAAYVVSQELGHETVAVKNVGHRHPEILPPAVVSPLRLQTHAFVTIQTAARCMPLVQTARASSPQQEPQTARRITNAAVH